MLLRLALLAALAAAAVPTGAAQPQFWRVEGAKSFLDGETEGLSVDSYGRVRLAPASRVLHEPETPHVWSIVRDRKGTVHAGTGNEGKVFRIREGKAEPLYDAAELAVHALALGPDGKLYVGTSPDGKVWAVDEDAKASSFYDPADKYVWALAFDSEGRLLVATGLDGKVHRVDAKGQAEILFSSTETHILSLATDRKGNVYAGSSPGGIVYRIDSSGKVFVLHDTPFREAKAFAVGEDGSLYVALVDGKETEDPQRSAPGATPVGPVITGADVTVTEVVTVPAVPAPAASPAPRALEASRPGSVKGAVARILPSGEIDTLWSSTEDTPHALAAAAGGGVYVGTGDKGKLYKVEDDRSWTMVIAFPAEQVTALHPGDGIALATSNPGRIHMLETAPGLRGTFTSKARDTETVSTWGRLRWQATQPQGTEIQVQTRSGNTGTPDSTWSPWSASYARSDGDPVTSDRARFLQLRVTLAGAGGVSPVLDSLEVAYLQRNLRPRVTSVAVHPPGEVFQKPLSLTGEIEILGLDATDGTQRRQGAAQRPPGFPPATMYSRKLYQKGIQTFSWKADDPNGDDLLYDVFYRGAGDTRFRSLRTGLTEEVLAWDTSTVPNGRYVIKVAAGDSPSNPANLSLTGEKESLPFDVDNTPPLVTASLASRKPPRVQATARDENSTLRKAEYSADGARWQEVHPVDGISDALEETYEFALDEASGPVPRIVVVRVTDALGNVASARVVVP